ncbi:hypothetical protein BZA05DRAFT_222493 [Tricharina praecox]|uniref:uncharacterized protein n=1 Tax=Tricharina praecox TaxID=43433 RepID=UPI00221EA0C2|nr:uncharacterized protein BZA05DRAFT_222493 [Tricharina praecox]KAI5855960.1 hypothetical protein BZA05DRAFT_222493 [Tricharina praecox]
MRGVSLILDGPGHGAEALPRTQSQRSSSSSTTTTTTFTTTTTTTTTTTSTTTTSTTTTSTAPQLRLKYGKNKPRAARQTFLEGDGGASERLGSEASMMLMLMMMMMMMSVPRNPVYPRDSAWPMAFLPRKGPPPESLERPVLPRTPTTTHHTHTQTHTS